MTRVKWGSFVVPLRNSLPPNVPSDPELAVEVSKPLVLDAVSLLNPPWPSAPTRLLLPSLNITLVSTLSPKLAIPASVNPLSISTVKVSPA